SIQVRHLVLVHFARQLRALDQLGAPPRIKCAVLRRSHKPGARILRDALLGPSLKCRDQSILRELLRNTDIAREAHEAGDDLRLLDAPDRIDRLVGIGSRHGPRLEQLRPEPQARSYSSAAAFSLPSPSTNWVPTILSISTNTCMILAK